ncbi:hypothetical protein [Roseivirga pacifica]|nr:hypothetical protein [Roseivirga pacifica]
MEVSNNIISKNGLQEAAQKEDWEQLWINLIAFSIKRLITRYGIKGSKDELLALAEKKLSEVLSLTLVEGTRNWNTDEYPTFKDFLESVIDSHINNSFRKASPKESPDLDIPDASNDLSPEDSVLYKELRSEAYDFLLENGASDDELMIFECMADGIIKPKAIRKDLGMSETDFHNAWRRLKPRILKLRKKLSSHD